MGLKPRTKFMHRFMGSAREFKARARDCAAAQREVSAALDRVQEQLNEVGPMVDKLAADTVANPSAESAKAIRLVREARQKLL